MSDPFSDFSSLDDLRKFLDPNSDAPGIIAGLIHQQGLLHFLGSGPGIFHTDAAHAKLQRPFQQLRNQCPQGVSAVHFRESKKAMSIYRQRFTPTAARRPLRLLALALLSQGCIATAHAWTVVVDSAADATGPCASTGLGPCTLRDAITYANANRNQGGDNRIEFRIGAGESRPSSLKATGMAGSCSPLHRPHRSPWTPARSLAMRTTCHAAP
ncbi:CSLREA domain-containing protein [Delftia sp.]|uniref:CSLREA domain-containing protein n=1 Tax=Delftia sp. TaxID=1886637 RepID=UPI00259CCFA2|nr:CSLREA domain-containing protein [Delftia sp.]